MSSRVEHSAAIESKLQVCICSPTISVVIGVADGKLGPQAVSPKTAREAALSEAKRRRKGLVMAQT
jgi:hypothetical protein